MAAKREQIVLVFLFSSPAPPSSPLPFFSPFTRIPLKWRAEGKRIGKRGKGRELSSSSPSFVPVKLIEVGSLRLFSLSLSHSRRHFCRRQMGGGRRMGFRFHNGSFSSSSSVALSLPHLKKWEVEESGRGMAVAGGARHPPVFAGGKGGRHYILLLTADGLDEWLGKERGDRREKREEGEGGPWVDIRRTKKGMGGRSFGAGGVN